MLGGGNSASPFVQPGVQAGDSQAMGTDGVCSSCYVLCGWVTITDTGPFHRPQAWGEVPSLPSFDRNAGSGCPNSPLCPPEQELSAQLTLPIPPRLSTLGHASQPDPHQGLVNPSPACPLSLLPLASTGLCPTTAAPRPPQWPELWEGRLPRVHLRAPPSPGPTWDRPGPVHSHFS